MLGANTVYCLLPHITNYIKRTMRKLEEICKDIEVINNQMNILKERKEVLYNEKRERLFADFCEKYGVKKGDVVHTDHYGDMMVCGIDARWGDWIQVRKIKKNGEPYSVCNGQSQGVFEGCEVIGHIDVKD